jgi:hypothetical protein
MNTLLNPFEERKQRERGLSFLQQANALVHGGSEQRRSCGSIALKFIAG